LNELVKGAILFFTVILMYFIITTALEYFFWLSSLGRAILFWSLIAFSTALFVKFIIIPIGKLFKFVKGIDYKIASEQIGKHFPEVSDKLLNLLQLKEQGGNDELVLAGIEQKSKELRPVPFQSAVNFKNSMRYARYAVIPVSIIIAVISFGRVDVFTDSYSRVVNYKTEYEPPAPFYFQLNAKSLKINEGEDLNILVSTLGESKPENAKIIYKDQSFFLKPLGNGNFTYTFEKVNENFQFYFSANEVSSELYNVDIVKTPKILDFSMNLKYPKYTNIADKTLQGQGSISIPEGTNIIWALNTQYTDNVNFTTENNSSYFSKEANRFVLQKKIFENTNYGISTSNENLENYETLSYQIKVIKDQYPKIKVEKKQDSTNVDLSYHRINVTDDYGLRNLRIVYYEQDNPKSRFTEQLSLSKGNFYQTFYSFPNKNLNLKEGITYEYYFEVSDNDAINGSKFSQSQVYGYREKTQSELENNILNKQSKSIDSLNVGLKNLKSQEKELKEIEKLQKEKKNFNYSDKQKMANFIKRQKQQREMMKDYMKSLKESLSEFQPEEKNPEKEALQKRLENNEKKLQENEELLKELEKYQNKLEDEKLKEKLDKFSKSSKQQEKSLEQLLELTKRYYVEQKAQKIAEELNDLAEKQEGLSKEDQEKESQAQDSLNKAFDKLKEDLNDLDQENEKLKEPMQIERDQLAENLADQAQEEAQESLEKSEGENTTQDEKTKKQDNANQQQKKASEQMKKMSKSMSSSMMSMSAQQKSEDAEMLRQILDNLITFSKEQEALMEEFKALNSSNPNFAKKLRRQGQLRENFEHVDDSLFALALRNPIVSDDILTKLVDIQYDIDKSIERLAETQIRLGTTSQQYVMSNANELSNMLDSSLDQIQMQMSGSGQGQSSGKGQGESQGSGFQLSDIIKSHNELQKQMQNQGQKPGDKPGGQQSGNKSGKEKGSQKGSSGEQGQGQSGNQGNKGKDGKGEKDGDGVEKSGLSNEMSGEIFEIFKQQQELRNQLEDKIRELGLQSDTRNLERSLDQLEEDMLMQGFSSDVLKQMENIKHQLLKLEKAAQKQGQDTKREATTNYKNYQNNKTSDLKDISKEYFESFEILNRQQLPLQIKYKQLIKKYFNEGQD
jgi:hypothetical protein